MHFNIYTSSHEPIALFPVVPDDLHHYIVAHSTPYSTTYQFCHVLFQELIYEKKLTALYNVYVAERNLSISYLGKTPALQMHFALKGNTKYSVKEIGNIEFFEGQFNFIFSPHIEVDSHFEQNEYITFNLYFPVELIREYAEHFPYLNDFIAAILQKKYAKLFFENEPITAEIHNILSNLLHDHLDTEWGRKYLKMRIKQLLLLSLMQYQQNKNFRKNADAEAIYKAKTIIDENLSIRLIIGDIALQTSMSESKLRQDFRQVLGIGILDYIIEMRMEKARGLLRSSNMPIKEIAALLGYGTQQSFSTEFKKHFHYTPGSLRKKK